METQVKASSLTIPLKNFNLSYEDVGEGSTPIIFLHGYPFDKTMWQDQVDFLVSFCRLITCDIRGFGQSKDEKTPLSIDLFTDDLIQFMNKLNIQKAIVCGLSLGGYIALNAIKRYPERFDALILCDTQSVADTTEVKEKRYETIEEIEDNGVSSFNEKLIRSVFHDNSFKNKRGLVEQLRMVVSANSEHIIKQGLVVLAERSETSSILNDITVPTLIICGREDEVTPLAQSNWMHNNIKGSTLQVINNAGHVSNLEKPDEFNKCLLDFLETLTSLDFEKVNGVARMS